MIILGIDTSCDDTSIAVIKAFRLRSGQTQNKGRFKILSSVVSSQVKLHQEYGGVYPSLAKREHQKNLVPVLEKALKGACLLMEGVQLLPHQKMGIRSKELGLILEREPVLYKNLIKLFEKYQNPKIDAIAVTVGPGLEPCLWVGVNFARALSFYWNKPIIPINHIEGHILANLLPQAGSNFQSLIFNFQKYLPAVALVVSGGHTQLILMQKIGKYEIIGETRDDAAGECFDKTARILGLKYPGGPEIAKQAEQKVEGVELLPKLPRPMLNTEDYDFSFSGLKTAVLYDFKKRPKKQRQSKIYITAISEEIQQAIIDVLIKKTLSAVKQYRAKTIILGGGVTANFELRKQFKKQLSIINKKMAHSTAINFFVPQKNLSTDNAAMIALTAYFHQKNKKNWQKVKVNANLKIGS